MEQVEGKVAVVTGAASGIGLAMATRFTQAGMKVVLADIERSTLDDAVAALEVHGAEVLGVPTDVSDGAAVEALRDAAIDRFGTVHVVCNNAGVGTGGLSWDQSIEDWEWVLGVNLYGIVHGIRAFMPVLLEQGEGHVVNTASMAGLSSPPMMGIYNVSKHSAVTLSETMFGELAMLGSEGGVSVLCPGWVNTRIHEAGRNRPASAEAEPTIIETDVHLDPAEVEARAAEVARGEMFRSALEGVSASGLDPSYVADLVLDAILTKRFYILTHPESSPMITRRMESIVNQQDPSLAFLPMEGVEEPAGGISAGG